MRFSNEQDCCNLDAQLPAILLITPVQNILLMSDKCVDISQTFRGITWLLHVVELLQTHLLFCVFLVYGIAFYLC